MKQILVTVFLILSISAFAQDEPDSIADNNAAFKIGVRSQFGHDPKKVPKNSGYGYIAMGGLAEKGSVVIHPSFGIGFRNRAAGIGVAMYYNKNYHLSLHGDLRFLFADGRKMTPFLAIQPGKAFYTKETKLGTTKIKQSGGFAFNALLGVMNGSRNTKAGPYFSVGYGQYTINVTTGSKVSSATGRGAIFLLGITI